MHSAHLVAGRPPVGGEGGGAGGEGDVGERALLHQLLRQGEEHLVQGGGGGGDDGGFHGGVVVEMMVDLDVGVEMMVECVYKEVLEV